MKQWTIIYRPHYSAWFGKCGEELQDEILAHLEVLKTVDQILEGLGLTTLKARRTRI